MKDAPQTNLPLVERRSEVIIRQYGLLNPVDWGPDCEEELLRMTQLWNRLAEIEAVYRDQYRDIIAEAPGLNTANEEITGLSRLLQGYVAEGVALKGGRRKILTPELDAKIYDISSRLAQARRTAGLIAKAFREQVRDKLRLLEMWRRNEVKLARQRSTLWWGNYNSVIKSFERGRSAALRTGGEMQLKHHDGSGRFTNQIQGGINLNDLFSAVHSQVSVKPLPIDAWSHPCRGERRRLQRTSLTVTVFTQDGKRRTVTWPMVMHRPIPDDCRIKEVVVTRRKVGTFWRWQVVFTCTKSVPKLAPQPDGCNVAVNVGWRRLPEGIRVATVVREGSAKPEFIVLPEAIVSGFKLVNELRSRRSKQKNELVAWLKTIDWSDAPEEIAAYIKAMWQAPYLTAGRLASLSITWRHHKYWRPYDFARLEEWRSQDKKLLLWEANQREKLICRRQDFYRKATRAIVTYANKLVLNEFDIRKTGRQTLTMSESNLLPIAAGRYRTMAAPSQLRKWIDIQAQKAGVATVISNNASTWVCHVCGTAIKPSRPNTLRHCCPQCREIWDQDVNACRNMLKRI